MLVSFPFGTKKEKKRGGGGEGGWRIFFKIYFYLSDRELCHSTSKPISDKEETLKSFMVFDITSRRPIFRVVVGTLGSQIVVPTILY